MLLINGVNNRNSEWQIPMGAAWKQRGMWHEVNGKMKLHFAVPVAVAVAAANLLQAQ